MRCTTCELCRGVIYCGGLVFLFRFYDVGGSRLGGVEMPIGDVVLCRIVVGFRESDFYRKKRRIRRRRGERGCVGDGVDVCDKVCYPPQLYGAPAASDQHCEEADVIGSPTPPSCTPQSPAPQPPARALFFELIRVIRRICRVARFYAFGSMKERYRIQIKHAATRKVQGKSGIQL